MSVDAIETDPPRQLPYEEEPAALAGQPVTVTTWILIRVFWRSFFFLAAANYQRMQNVGFAHCMLPALRRLHRGTALRRALERHLEFFNSHPYMAGALLGASIRIEESIAAGTARPDQVRNLKRTLMGPLAAVGDGFFWTSLKPFGATLAIAGVLSGMLWAPIGFLILYNVLHVGMRAFGVWRGYARSEAVVFDINRLQLARLSDWAHMLTGGVLGLVAAQFAALASGSSVALGDGLESILLALLTVISLLCLKRQLPMLLLLYAFAGGTALFVMGLQALFPIL